MVLLGNKITKQLIYKFLGIFVVGVIVLGVATYVFLIQREKAQFAQAEKEIDALYAQIVEKVGKPDQEKKEKSCGYASRVYGKGPRGCSIFRELLYVNKNNIQSNEMMDVLSKQLQIEPTDSAARENIKSFPPYTDLSTNIQFEADINLLSSKNCGISFKYPLFSNLTRSFEPDTKENFQITISCSGSAMAEYFPVTKN